MVVLGFIPARGGSKGLPRKNLRVLGGEPLIHWTIRAAQQSRCDRVVVSSEDTEILNASTSRGALVVIRSERLASDTANADDALAECIEVMGEEPDIVLRLQPTSPLRTAEDIDRAIGMIDDGAQAVVGVTEPTQHPYLGVHRLPSGRIQRLYGGSMNVPRQQYPDWKMVCGAIYAARTEYWREYNGFFGPETVALEIPKERSIDIDDDLDLDIAEMRMVENVMARFPGCS